MKPLVCHNELTISKMVKEFIGNNKNIFIIYVIFVLIIPLQDVGLPHLFGKLIKNIQAKGLKNNLVMPLTTIIVILFILQAGYSAADYVEIKMFPAVQKYVRNKMMEHIFLMQSNSFEELKIGEITTKLIKMPALMYTFMDQWKNLFIPQTVVFIVAFVYFFIRDKVIALTLAVVVFALVFTIYKSVFRCEELSKKRDNIYNALYEEVDDVLRNVMTVLNYNQETDEITRIDKYHEEYTRLSEESLACALRVRYIFLPIILGYLVFFTYYSYKRMMKKQMDVGTFVSLFIIMLYITNSMWKIIGNVKELVMRWGMIQESLEIFNICDRTDKAADGTISPVDTQGIVLKNVSYSFADLNGNVTKIFDNVNIVFEKGQRTLIVGQIGSGKTTTLKLIMKYIEPQRGEVYIDGIPYSKIKTGTLRKIIGYIPQNPILFNRTIYDNVIYGTEQHYTKDHVNGVIQQLGLSDIFKNMPAGLDTNVGKYGSRLSGGQRQVVWILRTILQNPEVILMDEPTSSIDKNTKELVNKLLQVIMKDKTVIMVTHDPFLLRFTDRILEMRGGKVIRDEKVKSHS